MTVVHHKMSAALVNKLASIISKNWSFHEFLVFLNA